MKTKTTKDVFLKMVLPIVVVVAVVVAATVFYFATKEKPIVVSVKDLQAYVGETKPLEFEVSGGVAVVSFEIEDETVAKIENGRVTGLKADATTLVVVAKTSNQTAKSSCTITIVEKQNSGEAEEPKNPTEGKEETGNPNAGKETDNPNAGKGDENQSQQGEDSEANDNQNENNNQNESEYPKEDDNPKVDETPEDENPKLDSDPKTDENTDVGDDTGSGNGTDINDNTNEDNEKEDFDHESADGGQDDQDDQDGQGEQSGQDGQGSGTDQDSSQGEANQDSSEGSGDKNRPQNTVEFDIAAGMKCKYDLATNTLRVTRGQTGYFKIDLLNRPETDISFLVENCTTTSGISVAKTTFGYISLTASQNGKIVFHVSETETIEIFVEVE